MIRTIGRRVCIAFVITGMMIPAVHAQQPTVVFSIRGVDPLIDDADFLASEVGQAGMKANIEQVLAGVTQGKGLAGIDRAKPLGVYWNSTAGGPPEMPVAFIPVSDAKALKGLLTDLAPEFEDDNGTWSSTINGTKVIGKISNGYLFISPNLPARLPDASKIANTKYDTALEVSLASIPQPFKDMFLEQVEAAGRKHQEEGPEPANEAERVGREWGFNASLAVVKGVVNDGDKLTLGIEVDQKSRLGAVDLSLTGKSTSGMAKVFAAYGKIQPAFAGIGSDATPMRMVFSLPTPTDPEQVEAFFTQARKAFEDAIDKDAADDSQQARDFVKGIFKQLANVTQSTVKSGALHAGVLLESGTLESLRVIGGAKVANGDEVGKLLDEVIKQSKSNPDVAKLKLDVAKYAGARIHEVTVEHKAEDHFGDGPAHLAFRNDSLWFSIGGDNLDALKKALDAKPGRVAGSPISLQFKPAALMLLMADKDEVSAGMNEKDRARAKKIVGKPGDKLNVDVAPINSGIKLRVEMGIDLLQLADIPGRDN